MSKAVSPRIIAEIGCNHAGDLAQAIRMIGVAADFCSVNAVKFQKRDNRTLLPKEQYDAPHPNPMHSFGSTYGLHREALEFDVEQHRELMATCGDRSLIYSTSVWDVPSARSIAKLEPEFLKVPSACNNNAALIQTLCSEYGGEIHVSLGMTTRAEEEELLGTIEREGATDRLVLYACTSGYPVPFEDLSLREVQRLVECYGSSVRAIGFSGHHLGIAADIAALTMGATYFERHFTLDRTSKGTDHSASLEPDGMRRLARDLRNVAKALTYKRSEILPIEEPQRDKLKWRNQ